MRFDEFVLREYGGSNGTIRDLAQYWRGEVPSFPFFAAGALVVATIKGVSIHRVHSVCPLFCSEAHKATRPGVNCAGVCSPQAKTV